MIERSLATIAAVVLMLAGAGARSAPLALEKDELKLGFIKLTDMAPLAIAYELGYFEDEGLFVTLDPQANWKVLLDRVITGELDGALWIVGRAVKDCRHRLPGVGHRLGQHPVKSGCGVCLTPAAHRSLHQIRSRRFVRFAPCDLYCTERINPCECFYQRLLRLGALRFVAYGSGFMPAL